MMLAGVLTLKHAACLFAAVGCAIIIASATAVAQDASESTKNKTFNNGVVFSTHEAIDNGRPSSVTYDARLPALVETKVGVDFGVASSPAIAPPPETYLGTPGNGNTGAAWANFAVPASPLGIDQAALNARVNSADDTGKVGVALSRKVSINESLWLTLRNSYGVTSNLAAAEPAAGAASAQNWETSRSLRIELPRSKTAFSAGEDLSTMDEKWLRRFSAEQNIYGPLNITGTIAETPEGGLDKIVKAGFKKTW
jgi:hypothetical protein